MQKEQLSEERITLPIGQISLHNPHLLHFSSSTFTGVSPSNFTHNTSLFTFRASLGQILRHSKHALLPFTIFIISKKLNKYMHLKADVTVVGAGPAGSTTARTIAKKGFKVILVEKDEYPGKTNVCAGGIPKPVFEETGLKSDIIEKKILRGEYYYPWGKKYLKLNHVSVYRSIFDRALANKAVDEGAEMLANTLIKDVEVREGKVFAFFSDGIIESEIIVFADGPNTLAFRKFGIGFKPDADKTAVSVTCEVKWEGNPLDCFEFYYDHDITPWGYGWICPRRNTVNVGVLCLYSKLSLNLMNSLNYMLKGHPLTSEKLRGREVIWLRSALIPLAPARKIFGKRMLVVGDAAGMVDPVNGGGIMQAIHGGKLAGEVCVNALEAEKFSASFLSKYQNLWRKSKDYLLIQAQYLLSNIFLYLSKHDKDAYTKMAAFINGGIRGIPDTFRFIYLNNKRNKGPSL